MGSCIQMNKTIRINTLPSLSTQLNTRTLSTKGNKASLVNSIPQKHWLNVIDFLKFDELKEVGKVNRQFNINSRSHLILTKFFKKKTEIQSSKQHSGNETTFASEKRNSIGSFGRVWN